MVVSVTKSVHFQAARFPLDTFPYLKTLVGARCPSSQSSYYSQLSRAQVVEDAKRGTCSLKRADGSTWSVEELIAMEFAYMKGLAETEAKETVSEAVVTVSGVLDFVAPQG